MREVHLGSARIALALIARSDSCLFKAASRKTSSLVTVIVPSEFSITADASALKIVTVEHSPHYASATKPLKGRPQTSRVQLRVKWETVLNAYTKMSARLRAMAVERASMSMSRRCRVWPKPTVWNGALS
ncbi:MAG: hypothetical protein ACLP01_12710 [Solirubrobacteraceae bacterium]